MKNLIIILTCLISIGVFGQSKSDSTLKKNKWRIGINFSPDYCFRKIDSTEIMVDGSNTIRAYIVHHRDSIEIPKFGFTAGISIGYDFSPIISLESGIFYSNKGYQTKWSGPLIFNGSSQPLSEVKIIYRYSFIDVPMKVGVTLFNTRKLRGYINAGVVANLFLEAVNTAEINNSINSTNSTNDNNNYKKMNVSILGGIGMEYKFNDRFGIRIEPNFRYEMRRIIDAPITAYLWNAGLNIGMDYHF